MNTIFLGGVVTVAADDLIVRVTEYRMAVQEAATATHAAVDPGKTAQTDRLTMNASRRKSLAGVERKGLEMSAALSKFDAACVLWEAGQKEAALEIDRIDRAMREAQAQ